MYMLDLIEQKNIIRFGFAILSSSVIKLTMQQELNVEKNASNLLVFSTLEAL